MPFSVASHFAPFQYLEALRVYRESFSASQSEAAQIDAPHTMVGVNVVIAPTDAEAQHLFTTNVQQFLGVVTGQRMKTQPPRDLEGLYPDHIMQQVEQTLSIRAGGSPASVVEQLEAIVEATEADELIVSANYFDPEHRVRGIELLAEAWGL